MPPPAIAIDEVRRFLDEGASSDAARRQVLEQEVGLSAQVASDVVALPASFTRDDLLAAIGVGPTLLLEAHVADWVVTHPPPTPGADDATTLAYVNHARTTAEVLESAGVTTRAANGIVARRAGTDGRDGTSDDRPFTSIADLDSVPWVGPATIETIRQAALGFVPPAPEPEPVSNVTLLLDFLNAETTTFELLRKPPGEGGPGVASWGARELIAHRNGPDGAYGTSDDDLFDTLEEVDDTPGVGVATMKALEAFAGSNLAPALVPSVVRFLNSKDANGNYCITDPNDLKARTGLTILQATNLLDARDALPNGFETLEQVDAVPQIGAVSMQKLQAYADSLTFTPGTCP